MKLLVCIIHKDGTRGGIYFVPTNQSASDWLDYIAKTETEQGRPLDGFYGTQLEFGVASPAFIGGFGE